MSENITHTAVCDDCLRLMSQISNICDAFKQAASDHLDIAQLGAVTRSTDSFNPGLLKRLRDDWDGRQPKDNFESKLAYSLGALCHRAADRTMKPVFKKAAPNDPQAGSDSDWRRFDRQQRSTHIQFGVAPKPRDPSPTFLPKRD